MKKFKEQPPRVMMDPKNDVAFKYVFGNPKYPNVSISLINAVLNPDYEKQISSVRILNPNIMSRWDKDKFSILDILAQTNDNTLIDIEMQVTNRHDMAERTLFYLSRMISDQIGRSEQYKMLHRTVCINFVDFDLTDSRYYHNVYNFRNKDGEILTKLAEIHFIELKKLKKAAECAIINGDNAANGRMRLEDWGNFLNNPMSKEVDMLVSRYSEMRDAKQLLDFFNIPKKWRSYYRKREDAHREEASLLDDARRQGWDEGRDEGLKLGRDQGRDEGLKLGRDQGREQEKLATAKKLKSMNLPSAQISEATGLSEQDIDKL